MEGGLTVLVVVEREGMLVGEGDSSWSVDTEAVKEGQGGGRGGAVVEGKKEMLNK